MKLCKTKFQFLFNEIAEKYALNGVKRWDKAHEMDRHHVLMWYTDKTIVNFFYDIFLLEKFYSCVKNAERIMNNGQSWVQSIIMIRSYGLQVCSHRRRRRRNTARFDYSYYMYMYQFFTL